MVLKPAKKVNRLTKPSDKKSLTGFCEGVNSRFEIFVRQSRQPPIVATGVELFLQGGVFYEENRLDHQSNRTFRLHRSGNCGGNDGVPF
jgi:hypothetical protein